MISCFFLQTNFKISPRRFHWGTKQKKRERKIARMSVRFTAETKRTVEHYGGSPSPRGTTWTVYIEQQMYLLPIGLEAFATRQYGRLLLDKYIESNREADETAKKITQNEPSLVNLGNAELNPNRPIGIKGRKRCPGTRKLVQSIKKLGHSAVIFVDEYFTSQTCANCFGRFDRNTRRHRFKVCKKCKPTNDDIANACLPNKIVTELGKRTLKRKRDFAKDHIQIGDRVLQVGERLVSKVASYRKNWQLINPAHEVKGKTVVWHRDIVAARCILYKGTFNCPFSI